MATFYGDQFAAAFNTDPSSNWLPGDLSGEKKVLYFEYTLPATPPSLNDIIKLGKLPKGARVYEAVISTPDLGSAGDLTLGWSAATDGGTELVDIDGFLTLFDANAAADTVFMSHQMNAGGANPGFLKKFASNVDVELHAAEAWTATSGVIKGYIEYVTI